MRQLLIISVGMGIGPNAEAVESLAGSIAFSIENNNPDKVVFVVSHESEKETLPKILALRTPKEYEVLRISSPDNIQRIYHEIQPEMDELRREYDYMAVDYTSGTKAMTGALAMLGVLYEANVLCNVTGERKNGIVQMGTESLQTVHPLFAIAEKRIQTALSFFNRCQYEAALSIIEEIENRTRDERLIQRLHLLKTTSKAYSAWDKFDHDKAFKCLKQLRGPEFDRNKCFLGLFLRADEAERAPYYIADLYNNAIRRGDIEKKYDDAVARLYRVIELLAQHRLRTQYNIDSSDVSIKDLPETLKKEWGSRLMEGKMKIGLVDAYRLLKEKGDELGELLESDRMRYLLSKRNFSILAHGLNPVYEDTYHSMKEEVYRGVSKYIPNLDRLIEDSTFPNLENP